MQHKRCVQWHRSKVFVFILCSLGLSTSLLGQNGASDPLFARVPFQQWLAEGPRQQIPWKVILWPERLSSHQRLLSYVEILLSGKVLAERPGQGRLVALVQFTDGTGRVYQNDGSVQVEGVNPGVKNPGLKEKDAYFAWGAFVLPGDYKVTLALYDRETGEHNLLQRNLRVAPLKNDPLPDAWRDLPNVEFMERAEKAYSSYHPEIHGRLHLPLATQRPVQIEVLVNLTPSEILTGSYRAYNFNLRALIPILKTLSQMDVPNGIINLATLDLTRQQVSFEQSAVNANQLDWSHLREAVAAADPNTIDVHSLQDRKYNAAFLRDELARRIALHSEDQAGDPVRVFILLTSPVAFTAHNGLSQIELPRDCNCLIYHVRYNWWLSRMAAFDDIDKVLKPLRLRKFSASSPLQVRKALATMLAEISKAGSASGKEGLAANEHE
jgi:hypothetical protein